MRNLPDVYAHERAVTLTTDPAPSCGHEDCAPLCDLRTGEQVTYCEWATAPLEFAEAL